MSWIANLSTSGAEQNRGGSNSRKSWPRSSGGCSHLRPPLWIPTSFWWSRSHSHNSCCSQPQWRGFSVNIKNNIKMLLINRWNNNKSFLFNCKICNWIELLRVNGEYCGTIRSILTQKIMCHLNNFCLVKWNSLLS